VTGSAPKTYSLEELQSLPSESDWERVRREAHEGIDPEFDEVSPDASDLMRAEIEKRRRGRPSGSTKVSTTVRFDADVLDAFRSTGRGWQTRMNSALREWLKIHPVSK
jgi:uncharacterized protein (DUF4415 family)